MRRRKGRTLTFVTKRQAKGSKIYANEATRWNELEISFLGAGRINHSEA